MTLVDESKCYPRDFWPFTVLQEERQRSSNMAARLYDAAQQAASSEQQARTAAEEAEALRLHVAQLEERYQRSHQQTALPQAATSAAAPPAPGFCTL